jgi:hypothetical protein
VKGAGAAHDDGEDVNFCPEAVSVKSIGRRGVFVADLLCGVGELSVCAVVPAGGATVAAPKGGAFACPSAPTSTSTRWALVTLKMCHACHGREVNEVPAAAIRVINNSREAMYGGFWKI